VFLPVATCPLQQFQASILIIEIGETRKGGVLVIRRGLLLIDEVARWSGLLAAPLVLGYMAMFLYEMVSRYVFNSPTLWAHELSTFVFGAQFMLGGAYCFWRGSMVNVEIFHDRLPIRARAIFDVFLFVIPLVVLGAMVWRGGSFFLDSFALREHTESLFYTPLYPLRGVIPVAAFLFLLQAVAKLVRDVHLAITGEVLK
jgi:TRAP-type mannitol/chloroaromatic compound transport system permease small subunit